MPAQRMGATPQLLWGRVTSTKDCFTFSGPPASKAGQLLAGPIRFTRSPPAKMALDFGKLRFMGRVQGDRATLIRRGRYRHNGAAWTTIERITLQRGVSDVRNGRRKERWQGRYTYEECDSSGREGCPSRCTIEAVLLLE